ncbi:MAG TPA: transcription termination factor NusA [Nitrospirota bacterium]|nr:transcription termination factor NusA [Nitrospirota bacterium]
MSQELIHVIDQISKEKGISKEMVIEAVESALVSAAKKKYGAQRVAVQIDPKRGDIVMYAYKKVVPVVANPEEEITLEEALTLYPDAQMDGEVPLQVEFEGFGRIAAQTARQVIVQKVREAERDVILKEFNDKIGQLVNGIVLRHEKGAYYIDLGKTEAVLPAREQVQRESYRRGDRVRAYVLEVRDTSKGPQVVLSRAHPEFVARLFEMEVPEIYENIVETKGVVREAGDRTKIAVASKDSQVDPVGACVGMKGARVQAVVRELRGEKIDIIPWSEDPRIFIAKALSPAVVEKVGVTEEDRSALAVVADAQLSLAIGKKGQNVRLAAKLTGWKIDILSESEYDQERQKEREQEIEAAIVKETRKMAVETEAAETMEAQAEEAAVGDEPTAAGDEATGPKSLTSIEGVGPKTAEDLIQAGYDTVEKIAAMSDEEILAVPGIGEKTAQKILLSARALVKK